MVLCYNKYGFATEIEIERCVINVVLLNGSGGRIPKNWRFSELGRCLLQALEIHSNAGIFALESLLFSLHAGNQ